jgi:hypothetical protein
LFRQSAILERETGLEISRVTLCGWVMAVGELPVKKTVKIEAAAENLDVVQQARRLLHL